MSRWIRTAALATVHGVWLAGLSLAGWLVFALQVLAFQSVLLAGLVFLVPFPIRLGRGLANLRRARYSIPRPYDPLPPLPAKDADGLYAYQGQLYKSLRLPRFGRHLDWLMDDRATGRDALWLMLDPLVGGVLALAPAAMIGTGLFVLPLPWGIPVAVAGFAVAPALLESHRRWSTLLLPRSGKPGKSRFAEYNRDWVHCLAQAGLAHLCLLSVLAHLLAFPVVAKPLRALPDLHRHLAAKWTGIEIRKPYRRDAGIVRDPATWRDLLWLATNSVLSSTVLMLPPILIVYALWGLALPAFWRLVIPGDWVEGWFGELWWGAVHGSVIAAFPVAVLMIAVAVQISPRLLVLHSRYARLLLAPTASARLALRVQELTASRAEMTGAQEAEMRRIERDLHDGAQARLVAVGLGLGVLDELIERDPAAAKVLVAEVQSTSIAALGELRALVRGIHPPVLAERGLGDAVRAVALDSPLTVRVRVDLPQRLEAPVESAAYFAVSAMLTSAAEHARTAVVELGTSDGELVITVSHDSQVKRDRLSEIERRLTAFDGTVTVTGGTVRMAVPLISEP